MRVILAPSLDYSDAICRSLRSYPLLKSSLVGWRQLRARRGTNMSHLGHQGGGLLPSYRITSVSHMWKCKKRTWKLVRIIERPQHPSTRHQIIFRVFGKETW